MLENLEEETLELRSSVLSAEEWTGWKRMCLGK